MSFDVQSLGALCQIRQGKYLSPGDMSETPTAEKSIPVIGGNGILGYTDKASHTTDVALITCRGSKCGLIQWAEAPVWVSNNAMACDTGNLLGNKFLRYLFGSTNFSDVVTGSAQPQITIGHLSKKEFSLCPKDAWAGIVGLLGSLDDRITLLRETNTTLEAIAQALFKSWFVDFDPVRAKAEGRQPEGMDATTAALFPDSFEKSELGLVPKGWKLVPFGELLTHTIGGDWGDETPNEKNDTRVAIIRGTDIPDLQSGTANRVPVRYTSAKKLATRKLQDGDLVLEVSGGSKDQPTGRALYLTDALLGQFDCPVEPASFCRLLRPIDRNTGLLLAQQLTYIYGIGKTWEYQNQSTGIANFQTTHFLESELVAVPPSEVLAVFADAVRSIVDRGHVSQIQTLTSLRDTLLPRLISGQLRLPDVQGQLQEILP